MKTGSIKFGFKKANCGFAVVEILFVMIVVASIGGVSYFVYENQQEKQLQAQTEVGNTNQQNSTGEIDLSKLSSWEIYDGGQKDVQFAYPHDWQKDENDLWIDLYSPDYKESSSVDSAQGVDGAHVSIGYYENNLVLNNKKVDNLKILKKYIDEYGGNYAKSKSTTAYIAGYKGLYYKCGHYRQADCVTAIVGRKVLEVRKDVVNDNRKPVSDKIIESIILEK